MISIIDKYRLLVVRGGDGGSTGSGGGSNQSLNAALGRATPEQRDIAYGPGPSSDRGGRDSSDNEAAANAARIAAERATYEQQQAQAAATARAAENASMDAYNNAVSGGWSPTGGGGGGITSLIPAPEPPAPVSGFTPPNLGVPVAEPSAPVSGFTPSNLGILAPEPAPTTPYGLDNYSVANLVRAGDVPVADFNRISASYNASPPYTGTGQFYGTEGQVGVMPTGNIPFFAGATGSYTISPNTVGVPSIISSTVQMGYGFNGKPLGQSSAYLPQAPGPFRSAYTTPSVDVVPSNIPYFGTEQGMKQLNTTPLDLGPTYLSSFDKYSDPEAAKAFFSDLETQGKIPAGTVSKIFGAESGYGNNPKAFSLGAGPSGPFQFDATTGQKYGLVGDGFDYRLDFEKSAQAAAQYAKDISNSLQPVLGRQPTAGEIGFAYNQGTAGAKALLSNPDLPADQALAPAYKGDIEKARRAIINNGGDPTAPARQFTEKMTSFYGGQTTSPKTVLAGLSDVVTGFGTAAADIAKVALSTPAKLADTLESALNSITGQSNVPIPTPVERPTVTPTYLEAGSSIPASRTYTYDTMPKGPVLAGEAADAVNEAAARTLEQTPAQVASQNPQTFGDWLSGLFDTTTTVQGLEEQGKTALFPDSQPTDEEGNPISVKQWYADQYADGDINKVKSRIVDYGDGPVVDYYIKGLDEVLGEMISGPAKAIGDLFAPDVNKLPQGSYVRDPRFSDLFSQNVPSKGYGPYGDLTAEEYREQYGGGGEGSSSSKLGTASSVPPVTVPPVTVPPVTVPPPESTSDLINRTGMNLTRRQYTGNPLVEYGNVSTRYLRPYTA